MFVHVPRDEVVQFNYVGWVVVFFCVCLFICLFLFSCLTASCILTALLLMDLNIVVKPSITLHREWYPEVSAPSVVLLSFSVMQKHTLVSLYAEYIACNTYAM